MGVKIIEYFYEPGEILAKTLQHDKFFSSQTVFVHLSLIVSAVLLLVSKPLMHPFAVLDQSNTVVKHNYKVHLIMYKTSLKN